MWAAVQTGNEAGKGPIIAKATMSLAGGNTFASNLAMAMATELAGRKIKDIDSPRTCPTG